jgi:hypothetical protein
MKDLFATDYVIYDKTSNNVLSDSYGRVLLFGNKSEADEDCRGNEIVIPCTELPVEWQEVIKLQINDGVRLATIFYNDVFVSGIPNEIYANCPYVNVPIDEAIEYADNKIENREWDAYCIPELIRSHQVIFH